VNARLGIGLVGCGRIARMFHLPVLRDLPAGRLVAVADVDGHARAAAARLVPAAVQVADVHQLLSVPGIDVVVICLPTHLHCPAATAAFGAGKHVYVEKPLAVDLDGGLQIRAAWRASGLVGAVGFNFRFHPLYQAARIWVATGALGEPVAVRTFFGSAPRELPQWKRRRRSGGGALLDLACHHLDLVRFVMGTEVQGVSAAIRSVRSEDDTVAVHLHLSTGTLAQVLATASAAQGDRVEIMGTRATLWADRMNGRRLRVTPTAEPTTRAARLITAAHVVGDGVLSTAERLRPSREPSFAASLAAFLDGVNGGNWSGATIDDGCRNLAVVEAAERSATTGEVVDLDSRWARG
jgi:myo-inositol 2-dehydrogenase/D-chiro-inositol 1-dehydrogenase